MKRNYKNEDIFYFNNETNQKLNSDLTSLRTGPL